MNSKELLSVIIPIYNAEKYLDYCIESLLKQTYKNLEIILVENGSTDQSYDLCKYYEKKDARVHAFHLKEAGVSHARNFGILQASGKYILFVDSDDYCEPDYCKEMLNTADVYDNECMPVCAFQLVKGYQREVCDIKRFGDARVQEVPNTDILKVFKRGILNSLWNKIYVRTVILDHNLKMRTDLTLGEDLIFNLDYMRAAGVKLFVIINKPLYNYVRDGKESLDHKYYNNLWELTNLFLDEIDRYCIDSDIDKTDLFDNIVYYYYLDVFQNTFSKENNMSLREKFHYNGMAMRDPHFAKAVSSNIQGCKVLGLLLARRGNYFLFFCFLKVMGFAGYALRFFIRGKNV